MIQFACKSNTCTWTPGLMARKSLALSGAMLGACQRWNPDENGLRMNGERGNRGNRVGRAERSWRRKGGGGLAVWDWLETHHTVGTLRSFVEFWEIIKTIQATTRKDTPQQHFPKHRLWGHDECPRRDDTREKNHGRSESLCTHSLFYFYPRLCSSFVNRFLLTLLQLIPSTVLSTYWLPIQVLVRIIASSFHYSEMGVR